MTIDELRKMLTTDIVDVRFRKKNGDIRDMKCTLISDYLPEVHGNSQPNEEVITVWDLEKQAWRAFRYDSLISVDTEYYNYVVE